MEAGRKKVYSYELGKESRVLKDDMIQITS